MTLQLLADEIAAIRGDLGQELLMTTERVRDVVLELRELGNPTSAPRKTLDLNGLLDDLQRSLRRLSGLGDRVVLDLTDNATPVAERSTPLKLAIIELLQMATEGLSRDRGVTVKTLTVSAGELAAQAPNLLEAQDHVLLGVLASGQSNWVKCEPLNPSGSGGGVRHLAPSLHALGSAILLDGSLEEPRQLWLALPSATAPTR